jgi:anti-sigma28 factor (negative regulator of flagellin synthesis)
MIQPEKRWFDRPRSSRPSRPARRYLDRSAKRLSNGRRVETNKNERSTVREELVDRVRQEIEAGTYDTLIKMEAALDRLLVQFS